MPASPSSNRRNSRRASEATAALFVRIPTEHAKRLDRAAFELKMPKQNLVSGLVERYVDPDSPQSLAVLGERRIGADADRRVTIEAIEPEGLAVGHHSFQPRNAPEVLTAEDAAELLQVEVDLVLGLARTGELPGRELGGEWRFARTALLHWLEASDS